MTTERTYLVTGANSGIGRATAHELALRGGHVVLACRSEARTAPVIDAIVADTGNEAVEFLHLDLADLTSVRAAAAAFLQGDRPLHVLVNNAGVGGQRGETAQGFELAFGVNHLGHFLLTVLLLDRLRASAPARVVNVSSDAHHGPRTIDFDRLGGRTRSFTGMPEYAISKLCNVAFTHELAHRLPPGEVATHALHPGVVASAIWRRIPRPGRALVARFMRAPEEGAATSVFCATAPELEGSSGGYYVDCRPAEPNPAAAELAAELWERSGAWTETSPAQ